MTVEELVSRVTSQIYRTWAWCTLIGSLYLAFTQPLWILLPFWLCAVVCYYGSLFVAGMLLSVALKNYGDDEPSTEEAVKAIEEINRRVGDGTLTPGPELDALMEAAALNIARVTAVSEKKIGRYMDEDIHEWIEMKVKGETIRFFYDDVAIKDPHGNPIMPEGSDHACLNGLLYKREAPLPPSMLSPPGV